MGRDISMTDLESARKVVADLAAASSAVYPGLEWAVGVARGVSGQPELWIATNEGAGYVPAGVFVPRSMPLAARFDSTFDARWFGWFNPAETVLRAIQARGDAVSAVATSFMSRSDLVDESVADVAVGVPAAGGPDEAEASQLLRSRSHRLETVAPGLYLDLTSGDPGAVDAYVRHVTGQAVFNCGPELSPAAQSVARAVVAGRWPAPGEWSALRDEYSSARLMAGSQRPGVIGIEDPQQLMAYQRDFAECRRLEVLTCWETGTPADVVYAAWCAGVPTPSFAPVNA
ncbi:putative methyl-accepting chemotaxis sensory transducer [Mycolicibacterium conceptionense]|nr:chemotaxis protein [Mycolicibacterium conceptionense]CQD25027.1 putative methyl-accepting chemotaxis sensory transducer [Mycolicibacterium conceptionense]